MASKCRSYSRLTPSSNYPHSRSRRNAVARSFHSTARRQQPEQLSDAEKEHKQRIFEWLQGPGRRFKLPLKGSTNYLNAYTSRGELIRAVKEAEKGRSAEGSATEGEHADTQPTRRSERRGGAADGELPPESLEDLKPFPANMHFRSQAVLSEDLREEIWRRVTEQGEDVKLVSATMGVMIERVVAVVRMKEIEKRWQQEGKPLATPYSKAVMAMLPTTPFNSTGQPEGHESINDLQVHPYTKAQLFQPVPESRSFTREDAGRAFDDELLPAEKRIPHPQLVDMERDIVQGLGRDRRIELAAQRMLAEGEKRRQKEEQQRARQAKTTKVVKSKRWDFVFREADAEAVGADGRGAGAVGWRYGLPHEDRKKGQVKIPTRVL